MSRPSNRRGGKSRLAGHEAMALKPYKRSAMTATEKETPIFPSLKEWHEQHSQKAAAVQTKTTVRPKTARVANSVRSPQPVSYWTTSRPWDTRSSKK